MSYALSSWFFTRAICLVYCVAFISLAVQARGLWGSQGILPITGFMEAVKEQVPNKSRFWQLPSVFWLNSSNAMVVGAAILGAVAAVVAFCGVAQGWMLLLCFALYLSYLSSGQVFMGFQWDALLVEVGFLALFSVPWTLSYGLHHAVEPHWLVRFAFYIVLFKLMFLSGIVKILSGDPSWRDLTAMTYHYWTQPLPNPAAPFINALPKWFHQFETLMTFAVELIAPFLIFSHRTRAWAGLAFVGLSVLIMVTGNYTFFNWLTIALAFWLIPDSWWENIVDYLPIDFEIIPPPHIVSLPTGLIMGGLIVTSLIWCTRWFLPDSILNLTTPVLRFAQMTHISNSYGLFANMTKARPEIIIEGSMDGHEWREYGFKYKPGNEYRMPPIVAPHQPRLDWQMWFAALGSMQDNPWLMNFLTRLQQGAGDVTALLDHNPFPGEPPKYLRARVYMYEFASTSEILKSGKWWRRSFAYEYR